MQRGRGDEGDCALVSSHVTHRCPSALASGCARNRVCTSSPRDRPWPFKRTGFGIQNKVSWGPWVVQHRELSGRDLRDQAPAQCQTASGSRSARGRT
eukprot:6202709-Pleurochrysis_carterae.AAC.5